MKIKTYIWCPDCGCLRSATVSRSALGGSKIRCDDCGYTGKAGRELASRRCHDCGIEIFAPARLLPSIPCACHAPEPKAYVCCPDCGRVAPVTVTAHLLGKRGVCGHCGAKMEMNMDNVAVCPDCGSTLYGQRRKASSLICPCDGMDFMDDRADIPSSAPTADREPYATDLRCSCGGQLMRDGDECLCPVCRRRYSRQETDTMEYFRRHSHAAEPITIAWDTLAEPDHVIYVHPHGGCVPPKSILLVEENQLAIYRTAGRYHLAQPGGPYTVFSDTRTEQQRIEAAYTEITGNAILLQLNTRILFFDSRYHEQRCRLNKPFPLQDSGYVFQPELVYELRITDPIALMAHALNLADHENEMALLSVCRDWAERAIRAALGSRIHAHFAGGFVPGEGNIAGQLETCLRTALSEAECAQEINRLLSAQGRGILIRNLNIDWTGSILPDSPDPATPDGPRAVCPHCGGAIRSTGADEACPHCKSTAMWCPTCAGYRIFDPRRVCTACGCKRYF